MSDDNKKRAPRVIRMDQTVPATEKQKPQPRKSATEKKAVKQRKPRAIQTKTTLIPVPDSAAQRLQPDDMTNLQVDEALTPPLPTRRKASSKWGKLFISAFLGLLTLAIGLWVDQLIRELFQRQEWLGWLATGLTALLGLAGLALIIRETLSLSRMAAIGRLRTAASKASADDDMKAAKTTVNNLIDLYSSRPDTAAARAEMADHADQIIDGRDLIALAERDLMKPLDTKAREMVMASAKRVSVVTAVSPRAIVDIGYVLVENMRLIRSIAELYGGRPGTFGFWRLARNVIGHLAITGSIAVGEGLVQQLVGHGLAAKISTRLGEGVVNGLLTARIGIAAIDVCRPLEFSDLSRPTIGDFLSELTRFSDKSSNSEKDEKRNIS